MKTNPANELFDGTSGNAPAFLAALPKQVKALASSNVSTIGMKIAEAFDEYESVSQRGDVIYRNFTDAQLTQAIQDQLTQLGSPLTTTNILDRASTQTCAGCHQLMNGRDLGGVRWPASRGFVQIDEGRVMSTALTDFFLPHRKTVLERFINKHCGPAPAAAIDDGLTVGGSAVGAAN